MNGQSWVLVADSANAKIFLTYKAKLFLPEASQKDLHLHEKFEHPASRKLDSELTTDNLGRYGSSDAGVNTYEPASSPKQIEEDRFAAQLIQNLHQAHNEHQFEELILVASPAFMGMLNHHITKSNSLKKVSITTIEKDYIDLSEKDLVKRLQEHL